MAYDSNVLRRATARLEDGKKRRQEELARKTADAYARAPRLAEIDRKLRGTIVEIVSAALRNGTDPTPAINVLRDKNLSLQEERADILLRLGLPADGLDEKPACAKCGDSGWRGSQMCDCLKALCAEEQIKELSKLLPLGEQCFDNFNLDWYSDRPWQNESRTPRENMEFIYEVCLHYAQKFGSFYFDNLLFTGDPGLGKTFLSACIARVVSENGFSVVYDTAVSVFSRFEEQKFGRDSEDGHLAKDETRRYLGCDLLILDDLGSELTTPFVQSALYTLINTRLQTGKRTVISTNLSTEELRRRYSMQVASRLDGEYHILRFYGDDIRLLRKHRL